MKNINLNFSRLTEEELETLAKEMVKDDTLNLPENQSIELIKESIKPEDLVDIDFRNCDKEKFKEMVKIALGV